VNAAAGRWTSAGRGSGKAAAGMPVPQAVAAPRVPAVASAAPRPTALAAAGGRNALSRALRALGRIERTLFPLQWLSDPDLRQRVNVVRSTVPAITHVDGTGRLQTVFRDVNPRYYQLIERFGQATGVPAVLNTSFNLKGEPIVNTPANAFNTFSKSEMDTLVLGNFIVEKQT